MIRGEFEERTWSAFWLTAVEDRAPKEVVDEAKAQREALLDARGRLEVARELVKEL